MLTHALLLIALLLVVLIAWIELRPKPAPLPVRRLLLVALITVLTVLSQYLAATNTSANSVGALVAPTTIGNDSGHAFTVPENLFRKITDEERADWQTRFAGVRT